MTRSTTPGARRKRTPTPTAKTADKHALYQLSVQNTESEIAFLSRVFKQRHGRNAVTLREDFCGTAMLCADWVRSRPERRATGLDLDPKVLAWGVEHNLAPIGEPGQRVRLLERNVLDGCKGPFDIAVALNFSYFVFRTREVMRGYFRKVRASLGQQGLFVLDSYGGYEAMQPMAEPRRIEGGFTYVWDQHSFDPITHEVVNHIHFEFRDGSKLRRAFTYEWRFWTLPELRELLEEAGFRQVTVYWEDADANGEGSGVFRPKAHAQNEPAFVVYIVAEG